MSHASAVQAHGVLPAISTVEDIRLAEKRGKQWKREVTKIFSTTGYLAKLLLSILTLLYISQV